MKKFGYLLITASFLSSSLISVLHPTEVNWLVLLPCLLVGAIGVFIIHQGQRKEASQSDKVSSHIDTMANCLSNIRKNLEQLDREKESLPTYEVRFDIDRLFREDLTTFAEIRKSMSHAFGLQKYADIMSAFAAGERYINRIWSASTDGYIDEVRTYLNKAHLQFIEAEKKFSEAKQQFA